MCVEFWPQDLRMGIQLNPKEQLESMPWDNPESSKSQPMDASPRSRNAPKVNSRWRSCCGPPPHTPEAEKVLRLQTKSGLAELIACSGTQPHAAGHSTHGRLTETTSAARRLTSECAIFCSFGCVVLEQLIENYSNSSKKVYL